MPDNKTTEVTHEITFSGHVVHGPEALALAKKIFAEQLKRYQESDGSGKVVDIFALATRFSTFESSTEPTDLAGELEETLTKLEPGLVMEQGPNGEQHISAAMIGRGLTRPTLLYPWIDPIPFVLGEYDLVPKVPYALRREEKFTRHLQVTFRVKKGPGKGRWRSYWHQISSDYMVYYGKRI